jgi:anti-sigma B factor antagonist
MVRPSQFETQSELELDSGRLTLTGELDIATLPRAEDAVRAMLGRGVHDLIIDLTRLTFIDSSGLRLFIVLCDRAGAEGWTLGLIPPPSQALMVFQISGAYENLPFIEDPRSS